MTPFDEAIDFVKQCGYHNHRKENHSDTVSNGILRDLLAGCESLKKDFDAGLVRHWLNVGAPGARERRIDLLVAEPIAGTEKPDLTKARICVENKSVITAHRNRHARYDDLNETMLAIQGVKQEAVTVATVLIGVARKVLNVPDGVKAYYKRRGRLEEFETAIRPRLSTGDQALWTDFDADISKNSANSPKATLTKIRQLPTRRPGHTHVQGYDFVMTVPVFVDNVNPPYIDRQNNLGLNVDADYQALLTTICQAYTVRWHM